MPTVRVYRDKDGNLVWEEWVEALPSRPDHTRQAPTGQRPRMSHGYSTG
jgi:hypothetical protein